jgi:ATP-dependent exoDNAse (exonuclease V) beta subunit
LVALICALLHPGDRTSWLALLRAPWAGLILADLLRLARGAPVIWEALSDDAVLCELTDDGRARCARIRRTLEAAFHIRNHGSTARWVEQTWLALGGASCATGTQDHLHAGRVFARLRELEEQGMPDAADIADRFGDLYADQGIASRVEIMTIHKAKGLEFDMVIVPALDRSIPQNRDELLLSHQFARAGRDGMVMAARPGVGVEPDKLFDYLRHQMRDAADLEADRLLYVACTRAKWQLHLSATLGATGGTPWTPRAGSLLSVLWPVVGTQFTVADSGVADHDSIETAPRGGPLQRVPRDWIPEMEYASPDPGPPIPVAPREEWPVFDWAGETARRVGSLVHAELQVMDLERTDEALIRAREGQYRRWLALHGVPADRLPEAGTRVISALVAVMSDARGRWILQRWTRDDVREHALSGHHRGAVVHVVFDRSFIDDQGIRWVIDYKTSQHSGGNLEEFLDREVERYRPQLHRYADIAQALGAEPVRVGLYFPLMRAWREWAPDG